MDLVWYVAYGSNLLTERFLAYLQGSPAGTRFGHHDGAADPRPPRDTRSATITHRLYLAGTSQRWGGSVAFVELASRPDAVTYARGYLISCQQLEAVAGQENGRGSVGLPERTWDLPEGASIGLDLDGKYDALIRLADIDDRPAVTLTTSRDLPAGAAVPAYEALVRDGLRSWGPLGDAEIDDYLRRAVAARSRPLSGDAAGRGHDSRGRS